MKKLIAIAVVIFALTSCKKETPAPAPGPNEWIVGNWKMTDLEVSGTVNVAGNLLPLTGEGSNYQGGYTAKSDKTATFDFSCDIEVVVPVLGSFPFPYSETGTGTWRLEDNNKTLIVTTAAGTVKVYPLKVLTENIMIIEQDTLFDMMGFSGELNYEITMEK